MLGARLGQGRRCGRKHSFLGLLYCGERRKQILPLEKQKRYHFSLSLSPSTLF